MIVSAWATNKPTKGAETQINKRVERLFARNGAINPKMGFVIPRLHEIEGTHILILHGPGDPTRSDP